ncbi:hypothetical protein FACS1894110_19870 [Spirochaetia bacterium]|nr:hypothetical protein FACS1894110_19870 [Spirochaetia bacterium]
MKKLIAISVLFTVLSVSVFAQFKASFSAANIAPEFLKLQVPIGDSADPANANYAGASAFQFFSGSFWKQPEVRLVVGYTDPDGNFAANIQFKADNLFAVSDGTVQPTAAGANPDAGFLNGNDTATTLLSATIGDFTLSGKVGKVTGILTNVADRGKVDRLQNLTDFNTLKQDNYGILLYNNGIGGVLAGGAFSAQDINNLAKGANPAWSQAFVAAKIDLKPIYIDLSGGIYGVPTSISGPSAPAVPEATYPVYGSYSWNKVNAGIRVSGVAIADALNFDLIYKIAGYDTDTDGTQFPQPDHKGRYWNSFGAYLQLTAVKGLGLSVGYSGLVLAEEKDTIGDTTTGKPAWATVSQEYINPFRSGIDLRVSYTGIDKLTLGLNNNFSFAAVKYEDDGDPYNTTKVYRGLGGTIDGPGDEDSYFAMYNALVAKYKITDSLTGIFELGNRFGTYKYVNDTTPEAQFGVSVPANTYAVTTERAHEQLRIAVSAAYTINSFVTLEGGLAFDIDSTTIKYSSTQSGYTAPTGFAAQTGTFANNQTGFFAFSVPLRLKVAF